MSPGDTVNMGDPIGIAGDNPIDHDARHLHWEVYRGKLGKYPRGTIDPERFLRGAKVLPHCAVRGIVNNTETAAS